MTLKSPAPIFAGTSVYHSDYGPASFAALHAEFLALKEHCAALESREVCAVAHEDVETCGYCQRDALAQTEAAMRRRLEEVVADCERLRATATPDKPTEGA